MGANKEAVLSEKEDAARWGQKVVASCSGGSPIALHNSDQATAGYLYRKGRLIWPATEVWEGAGLRLHRGQWHGTLTALPRPRSGKATL